MFNSNAIVTEITGYTEQHKSELLVQALMSGKSREMMNFIQVNGDTTLNRMQNDIVFQSAAECGFSHSGDTIFTQRVLSPKPIRCNLEWCDKVLIPTYQSWAVKVAAGREQLPYSEEIVNNVLDKISEGIEKMLYTGSSANTGEFQGLIEILDNDANSIKVNVASGTTALEAIRQVAAAVPKQIKDVKILVGADTYYNYVQDLVNANLFHYQPADYNAGVAPDSYVLPGTDIVVEKIPGLTNTGKIIAANMENIYYGANVSEDDSVFEFWFSKDDRTFKFVWEGLLGVQVAWPDEVVIGTLN